MTDDALVEGLTRGRGPFFLVEDGSDLRISMFALQFADPFGEGLRGSPRVAQATRLPEKSNPAGSELLAGSSDLALGVEDLGDLLIRVIRV